MKYRSLFKVYLLTRLDFLLCTFFNFRIYLRKHWIHTSFQKIRMSSITTPLSFQIIQIDLFVVRIVLFVVINNIIEVTMSYVFANFHNLFKHFMYFPFKRFCFKFLCFLEICKFLYRLKEVLLFVRYILYKSD